MYTLLDTSHGLLSCIGEQVEHIYRAVETWIYVTSHKPVIPYECTFMRIIGAILINCLMHS